MARSVSTRCLRTTMVFGVCLKCFQPVEMAHVLDPNLTPLWLLCGSCCPECASVAKIVEYQVASN